MKLTPKEKAICRHYSKRRKDGKVHCYECPLAIDHSVCECYATIDGRTKEAKELKRYDEFDQLLTEADFEGELVSRRSVSPTDLEDW